MGTNNPDLQHKFVHTKNKRLRKCANCSFKNVKTYGGHPVTSYFMCQACGVPLCKTMRKCFQEFHTLLEHGIKSNRRMSSSLSKEENSCQIEPKSKSPSTIENVANDSDSSNKDYNYVITLSSPGSQWCNVDADGISITMMQCRCLRNCYNNDEMSMLTELL
jgi:hypothetical protein